LQGQKTVPAESANSIDYALKARQSSSRNCGAATRIAINTRQHEGASLAIITAFLRRQS
jgi:hypothetical protein